MVKVLIYSSKEIYDTATYEGRAEAHFVAYRKDDGYYEITKNRTGRYLGSFCSPHTLNQEFESVNPTRKGIYYVFRECS